MTTVPPGRVPKKGMTRDDVEQVPSRTPDKYGVPVWGRTGSTDARESLDRLLEAADIQAQRLLEMSRAGNDMDLEHLKKLMFLARAVSDVSREKRALDKEIDLSDVADDDLETMIRSAEEGGDEDGRTGKRARRKDP